MEGKPDNLKQEPGLEDLSIDEVQQVTVKGGVRCGLIQKFSGGDIEGEVT